MKKTILFSLMLLLFSGTTFAQSWLTDIDTAKTMAAQEDKPIVLVFQGSDWCAPCIKLDREIWSTDEFKEYAKDHYVMLKADFPKRRQNALDPNQQERNNKLAEVYNKSGYFPFVVVLNKEGEVLGTTGYKKMEPAEFIKLLDSFKS